MIISSVGQIAAEGSVLSIKRAMEKEQGVFMIKPKRGDGGYKGEVQRGLPETERGFGNFLLPECGLASNDLLRQQKWYLLSGSNVTSQSAEGVRQEKTLCQGLLEKQKREP